MLPSSRSWTSLLHETVHRVTFQEDLALLILSCFSALDMHSPLAHFDLERLCKQSNGAFNDGPLLWKCDNITCSCRHCVELHGLFCVIVKHQGYDLFQSSDFL